MTDKPLTLHSRVKHGRWRDKRTHRFVSWVWGLFNPNTCERVPEDRK